MKSIPRSDRCILTLVLLVAIPCCATPSADAKEVPGLSARTAAATEKAAASAWLSAVRDKDAAKVARLSGVPFVEANLRNHTGCSSRGVIKTTVDLQRFAECVVGYALLVESIPVSMKDLEWEPISLASVPKALRTKLKALAADHALLRAYVMGDGLTFTILIAIRHDGIVNAVLSEVEAME